MSMGCYGCRDTADIGRNETVLGFPFKDYNGIVKSLEFLSNKAISNSREKSELEMLKRKEAELISKSDPFKNNKHNNFK